MPLSPPTSPLPLPTTPPPAYSPGPYNHPPLVHALIAGFFPPPTPPLSDVPVVRVVDPVTQSTRLLQSVRTGAQEKEEKDGPKPRRRRRQKLLLHPAPEGDKPQAEERWIRRERRRGILMARFGARRDDVPSDVPSTPSESSRNSGDWQVRWSITIPQCPSSTPSSMSTPTSSANASTRSSTVSSTTFKPSSSSSASVPAPRTSVSRQPPIPSRQPKRLVTARPPPIHIRSLSEELQSPAAATRALDSLLSTRPPGRRRSQSDLEPVRLLRHPSKVNRVRSDSLPTRSDPENKPVRADKTHHRAGSDTPKWEATSCGGEPRDTEWSADIKVPLMTDIGADMPLKAAPQVPGDERTSRSSHERGARRERREKHKHHRRGQSEPHPHPPPDQEDLDLELIGPLQTRALPIWYKCVNECFDIIDIIDTRLKGVPAAPGLGQASSRC